MRSGFFGGAFLAAIAVLATSVDAADMVPPAPYLAMSHDILKQLIEIDSTHAHGSLGAAQAVEIGRAHV